MPNNDRVFPPPPASGRKITELSMRCRSPAEAGFRRVIRGQPAFPVRQRQATGQVAVAEGIRKDQEVVGAIPGPGPLTPFGVPTPCSESAGGESALASFAFTLENVPVSFRHPQGSHPEESAHTFLCTAEHFAVAGCDRAPPEHHGSFGKLVGEGGGSVRQSAECPLACRIAELSPVNQGVKNADSA